MGASPVFCLYSCPSKVSSFDRPFHKVTLASSQCLSNPVWAPPSQLQKQSLLVGISQTQRLSYIAHPMQPNGTQPTLSNSKSCSNSPARMSSSARSCPHSQVGTGDYDAVKCNTKSSTGQEQCFSGRNSHTYHRHELLVCHRQLPRWRSGSFKAQVGRCIKERFAEADHPLDHMQPQQLH